MPRWHAAVSLTAYGSCRRSASGSLQRSSLRRLTPSWVWRFRKASATFLGSGWSPMSPRATAFGHPGSGGSIGFADPERCFAFGLTKTRLVTALPGQDAAYLIAEATRAALDLSD